MSEMNYRCEWCTVTLGSYTDLVAHREVCPKRPKPPKEPE